MKKANKVLSVLLVALMAVAFSGLTAFAAAPTSGSISVTTNKKGQTYTLYKLFDAEITFKEDNTQRAIAYTVPEGKTLAEDNAWFELNDNGFVVAKDGVTNDWAKAPEAIAWAKSFGTEVSSVTAASDNDDNVKWTGLAFGYYFVDSTLGAFITVDSNKPDAKVADKNELPDLAKIITAVESGKGSKTNTAAIAEFGAKVSYKLTVSAKPGAENYVVTDELAAGLTAPAAADVTVSDGSALGASDVTVAVSGQKITVTFKKAYLDTITADKDITIEYDVTVNSNAVIGEAGNANKAVLTWGHDNDDNKTEDKVVTVYTAQFDITKVDAEGAALEGAGFVIKKDNKYYKLADGVVTWVESEDAATELKSDADGKVPAFTGLADGTYTIVEKTVPAGYNKTTIDDVVIKTASESGALADANLKQTASVTNNAGVELPATGAMGTTIFYMVGLLAILGAGVFMVTNKRIAKEEI